MVKQPNRLARAVAQRKEVLAFILAFVQEVVLKHGTVTHYEEGSDWTRINRELKDFHGLDIFWKLGRSHHIDIYYGSPKSTSKEVVLSMTYWHDGVESCDVRIFSLHKSWLRAVRYAAENTENIVAKRKAAESRDKERGRNAQRRAEDQSQLLKTAQRLGLS